MLIFFSYSVTLGVYVSSSACIQPAFFFLVIYISAYQNGTPIFSSINVKLVGVFLPVVDQPVRAVRHIDILELLCE